jgi:hypothetical protein
MLENLLESIGFNEISHQNQAKFGIILKDAKLYCKGEDKSPYKS